MKVFLKLNNLFFTGKISAKGGMHFVMTESPAKAREFGSPEAAMSYLQGWNIAIDKNWTLEIEHEKPVKICDTYAKAADYIYESPICEICNGTGMMFSGEMNFDTGTNKMYRAKCEYCNNGFKKDYKPGGLYQEYRPEDYSRIEFSFYATPISVPEGVTGTLRYKPEKPVTRLFSDICKEADSNQNDYQKLFALHHEVQMGIKSYSEINYNFALEHIEKYISKIRERGEKESLRNRFED